MERKLCVSESSVRGNAVSSCKRLIINADDLGADEGRNEGIFEAIEAGAVTSASILANGPALDHALRRILGLGSTRVSWGLHLNLSEGSPLSSGLRSLVGPHGDFLGKAAAHRLLMREGDRVLEEEVAEELDAQVKALQQAGIGLRHLDGHQHIHVFPAVARAAILTGRRHSIPWFRIPEEPDPPPWAGHLPLELEEEARTFSRLARTARSLLGPEGGVRAADHYRGLYLKGRPSQAILRDMIRALPEGLTEFMVHPGRVPGSANTGPFSTFSTADREKELEVLLEPEFGDLLAGVILTPFPEVLN